MRIPVTVTVTVCVFELQKTQKTPLGVRGAWLRASGGQAGPVGALHESLHMVTEGAVAMMMVG